MPIKGLVFDLDGTLIDFVTIFDKILERTFAEFNLSLTPEKSKEFEAMALKSITGKSGKYVIVKLIWRIAKGFGLGFRDRIRFLKIASQNYKEIVKDVEAIPGAFEKLQALKVKGFKIAIVTTASREEVTHRFDRKPELLKDVDFIIGRDNVKHMKPAPDGILLVAKEFGAEPHELVMVGDMTVDVNAGKNAGAYTVGVLTGYGTREQLAALKPDLVLESVADLPEQFPDW